MKSRKRRVAAITLMSVCLLFVLNSSAAAKRAIPDDHIKYPVLVIIEEGPTATGFYVNNKEGDAYFVTSRHLLFKTDEEKNESTSELISEKALLISHPLESELVEPIYIELRLKELLEAGFLKPHPIEDVVVVKIGELSEKEGQKAVAFVAGAVRVSPQGGHAEGSIVGAREGVIKRYEEVLIGNEVFIFGYPTSLGIANYPQLDFQQPLLRKGIIAGKNDEKKTIILDCPVQYGNSGGPVIEVEPFSLTETRYAVIGMISEFIPFQEKRYGVHRPVLGSQIENSGYSVVIPMDVVLDLIDAPAGDAASGGAA